MTKRFAGVALAAMITCGWSGGAGAYEYIARGTITSFIHDGDQSSPNIVDRTFTLYFDGGTEDTTYSPTHTDLGLVYDVGFYSTVSTSFANNNGPSGYSFINNNGNTSSIQLSAFTGAVIFNGIGGDDAGLGFQAASSVGNIPLNPEQSFRAIPVMGSGSLSAFPYYDQDFNPLGGYTLTFNVTSLAGIGAISEVPLPASAPMFGAALLGLGALGYGIRGKKAAAAS